MNTIRKTELLRLISAASGRCVSIYMPTYHGGKVQQQNSIRLKNLLVVARAELEKRGLDSLEAAKFLAPAMDLLDRPTLWQGSGDGLAVLLAKDDLRVYRLPSACEELSMVGRRFHLTPLIAPAVDNAAFYVLAVSQNRARLLQGTRDELAEIAVPDLPASLTETLGGNEPEVSLFFRTGDTHLHGKESLVFHGQGGAVDVAKSKLAEYVRAIDRAIGKRLTAQTDPLVFAGVDYLFPIYRAESTYSHLLPTHVSGNPDLLPLDSLRHAAWSLIESALRERRAIAMAKYWDVVTHGRASNRIEDILPAAEAGAVETLFIDPTLRRLGGFDHQTCHTRLDEPPKNDSEDLVNLAATLVLTHGGTVESTSAGHIPGGGMMAAVMRYPVAPDHDHVVAINTPTAGAVP